MIDMEIITQALRRGMQTIADSWPYNLISAAIVYLFGGSEGIIAFVLVCVALDTISKWAVLTKKYLLSIKHPEESIDIVALMCGFFYAWKPNFISPTALRKCWSDKLLAYGLLISLAAAILKWQDLFPAGFGKFVGGGIYACIVIVEASSIFRNLEEYGINKLEYFRQLFTTAVNRIFGSNFSVTMTAANTMPRPGGITPPPPASTGLPTNFDQGGK